MPIREAAEMADYVPGKIYPRKARDPIYLVN